MHLRGVRLAYVWLIITSFIAIPWLFLLFIPLSSFQPIISGQSLVAPLQKTILAFRLDKTSWAMVFSFLTWILSYLLTAVIRLDKERDPFSWISIILIFMPTVFSFSAQNIISLIIFWTLSDILEIVYRLRKNRRLFEHRRNILQYLLRLISTFLAIWFDLGVQTLPLNPLLNHKELLLVFIVVFRSSVLPIVSSKNTDSGLNLAEEFFLRAIQFSYGLGFLSFANEITLEGMGFFVLLFILFILIIFSGYVWAKQKDLSEGISVQPLFFISLALISHFLGYSDVFPIFSLLFMFNAGFLSLYSFKELKIPFLLIISLVLISGLPFSFPFFVFNYLLISEHSLITTSIIFIPYVFAILGFLRKSAVLKVSIKTFEPLHKTIYLIGLLLLIVSAAVIVMRNYLDQLVLQGIWWVSLIPFIFALFLYFLYWKNVKEIYPKEKTNSKISALLFITNFLQLDWLTVISLGIFRILRNVTSGINSLLEGEGGILWSILILVLLISIFQTVGTT